MEIVHYFLFLDFPANDIAIAILWSAGLPEFRSALILADIPFRVLAFFPFTRGILNLLLS